MRPINVPRRVAQPFVAPAPAARREAWGGIRTLATPQRAAPSDPDRAAPRPTGYAASSWEVSMTRLLVAFALLGFSAPAAWACSMEGAQASAEDIQAVQQAEGAKATLDVSGLKCGNCVKKVKAALSAVDGVIAVAVDLSSGKAQVAFDAAKVSPERLAQVVTETGYQATVHPQS